MFDLKPYLTEEEQYIIRCCVLACSNDFKFLSRLKELQGQYNEISISNVKRALHRGIRLDEPLLGELHIPGCSGRQLKLRVMFCLELAQEQGYTYEALKRRVLSQYPIVNEQVNEQTIKQSITKETEMSNQITKFAQTPITTTTLVHGVPACELSDDKLLDAIRGCQKQIESYSDIKGSKKIKAKVDALKADIKSLTELLDGE